MATRDSLEKAQALKRELEQAHPGIEIRILDRSTEETVWIKVAEAQGLKVLSVVDDTHVVVSRPRFDVLEVRRCTGCGKEILTAAIGEAGLDECPDCQQRRQQRQQRQADGFDFLGWAEFHDLTLNA